MDFKQAIIENAWAGISIDYGMLHFINAFKVKFGYLVVALALCLTFSPLITTIVEEKERKLTAMMRMMGMDDRAGVLVAYLWNLGFASIFKMSEGVGNN